jgi:ATP-dependent Zn protease
MGSVMLYIDPGSGSYLIQVIVAGILGAAFYFKSGWNYVKSIFRKNKKED